VRLLDGDQELGRVGVGVQRVGGHDHAGKVQVGQQGLEGGHLTRRAVDLALGEHRAGGVVHRGQQVGLPAVCCAAGAAERLAVDRHRPSMLAGLAGLAAVCKPGADRGGQRLGVHTGQGPADRGLGGDGPHPAAGAGIAAGPERGTHGLGCLRGPLGDRDDRPGARQDRSSGEHQDGDQRVTAPGAGPGVGDGGEVGQQLWHLG
jgi:hypothetical protein